MTPSNARVDRPGRPRRDSAAEAGRPGRRELTSHQLAVRLLSETAHDLRTPLSTVRESVRLVRDGEAGEVNADQQRLLDAALTQCDCAAQMVDDMAQLERLQTGLPRVRRRWIAVRDVRQAVDETLQPWAAPRQVPVLWDGAEDPTQLTFADAEMLRRLVGNLLTNAVRATRRGQAVLVRLERVRGGEAIRWSVIDQGAGIEQGRLKHLIRRQFSGGGGEGLGLSICRQFASLHFSALTLRSRVGVGTEVAFETPACGPTSVAESWTRWRLAERDRRKALIRRRVEAAPAATGSPVMTERVSAGDPLISETVHSRIDPPAATVEVTHDGPPPRCRDQVLAGTVSLGAATNRATAEAVDELLQNQQRMYDLVYRVASHRWVWLLDTPPAEVGERLEEIRDRAVERIGGARLSWTDPVPVPIDRRRLGPRVSDLLVREALSASTLRGKTDTNEVRMGTAPVEHSPIAAERLDQEVRRLSGRLSRQSIRLQEQAQRIRPTP